MSKPAGDAEGERNLRDGETESSRDGERGDTDASDADDGDASTLRDIAAEVAEAAPDAGEESDSSLAEACVSTCSAENSFACSERGLVQACIASGGCLAWREVGPCPEEQRCCRGVCRNNDGLLDPACSELAPDGYDYYVDASQPPDDGGEGGDGGEPGSRSNPFRTISRALQRVAADAMTSAKAVRIYVGRGTYDKKLGEAFPLVVPGGVSLEGAGASRTTIAGLGDFVSTSRGSTQVVERFVTIVVGDRNLKTSVSGFTIVPGDAIPSDLQTAIYCDRGSMSADDSDAGVSDAGTPDATQDATDEPAADVVAHSVGATPNTILSELYIGPNAGTGIIVTSSAPGMPGCNMRVRASTIEGGKVGLSALCGEDPNVLQTLELGDGTEAGGNTFELQNTGDGFGTSASLGCLKTVSITYNQFLRTNLGVNIGASLGTPPVFMIAKVNHNVFDQLDFVGLALNGGGILVEELDDNRFLNITENRGPLGKGLAVGFHATGYNDPGYPIVQRARNNLFFRNDVAIELDSYATFLASYPPPDFGDKDDPGNNTFHCNGQATGNGGLASVELNFASYLLVTPVSFPSFQGNIWDSQKPIIGTYDDSSSTWPVGADVVRANDMIDVNVAGATQVPGGVNSCSPP